VINHRKVQQCTLPSLIVRIQSTKEELQPPVMIESSRVYRVDGGERHGLTALLKTIANGEGKAIFFKEECFLFIKNEKTFMINVFPKRYTKWRLKDSGAPSKKGQVKIQAICVRPRELYDNEYELCDCTQGDQFLNIDAYKLKPERGQTEPI